MCFSLFFSIYLHMSLVYSFIYLYALCNKNKNNLTILNIFITNRRYDTEYTYIQTHTYYIFNMQHATGETIHDQKKKERDENAMRSKERRENRIILMKCFN